MRASSFAVIRRQAWLAIETEFVREGNHDASFGIDSSLKALDDVGQLLDIMWVGAVDMVSAALERDSQPIQNMPDAGERQWLEPLASGPYTLQLPAAAALVELFRPPRDQVPQFFLSIIRASMLWGKKRACVRDQL